MSNLCKYSQTCAYNCLHIEGIDNTKCETCKDESEYLHLGSVLYYLRMGLSNKMAIERALTHDNRNTGFDIHGYPLHQSKAEIEIENSKYTDEELDELWKPL